MPSSPSPAAPEVRIASNPFFSAADWQDWAIRHRAAFDPLAPGARIGQVRRGDVSRVGGELLVIEASTEGPRVRLETYAGMARCDAHLLFVGADDAWRELYESGPAAARPLVRARRLHLYIMKNRAEIEAARLDEFLDRLDLAHPKH